MLLPHNTGRTSLLSLLTERLVNDEFVSLVSTLDGNSSTCHVIFVHLGTANINLCGTHGPGSRARTGLIDETVATILFVLICEQLFGPAAEPFANGLLLIIAEFCSLVDKEGLAHASRIFVGVGVFVIFVLDRVVTI